MKDTLICPICFNKLSNKEINSQLPDVPEGNKYIQRTCKNGIGHFLQIYTDPNGKVQSLLMTLGYDKTVRMNYSNNTTTFILKSAMYDDGQVLLVPRILTPDFPKLEKLKEKLSLYTLFS